MTEYTLPGTSVTQLIIHNRMSTSYCPVYTTWMMYTITVNKTTVELHKVRPTYNGCTKFRNV